MLRVWSVSVPHLWTTPMGISVRAVAAAELTSGAEDIPGLYFEMVSQTNTCFNILNDNLASDSNVSKKSS